MHLTSRLLFPEVKEQIHPSQDLTHGSKDSSKNRAFKARARGFRRSLARKIGKTKAPWNSVSLIQQQGLAGEVAGPQKETTLSEKLQHVFTNLRFIRTRNSESSQKFSQNSSPKHKFGSAHLEKLVMDVTSFISEHAVPAAKSTLAHIRSELHEFHERQIKEQNEREIFIGASSPGIYGYPESPNIFGRPEYGPDHYAREMSRVMRLRREMEERIKGLTPEEAKECEARFEAAELLKEQQEREEYSLTLRVPRAPRPVQEFWSAALRAELEQDKEENWSESELSWSSSDKEEIDENISLIEEVFVEDNVESAAGSADLFDWGSFASSGTSEGEDCVEEEIKETTTSSFDYPKEKPKAVKRKKKSSKSPKKAQKKKTSSRVSLTLKSSDYFDQNESASIMSNEKSDHKAKNRPTSANSKTLYYMKSNNKNSSFNGRRKQRPAKHVDSTGSSISLRSGVCGSNMGPGSRQTWQKNGDLISIDEKKPHTTPSLISSGSDSYSLPSKSKHFKFATSSVAGTNDGSQDEDTQSLAARYEAIKRRRLEMEEPLSRSEFWHKKVTAFISHSAKKCTATVPLSAC